MTSNNAKHNASVQSQDNLIHIIDSEKYTPSQVLRALQTALDDSRSFHFEKLARLPRVEMLASPAQSAQGGAAAGSEGGGECENESGATNARFFELLQLFAAGDLAGYVRRQDEFSTLMADAPHRVAKLAAICLRRLDAALDDADSFDFSEFLGLLDDPRCSELLSTAQATFEGPTGDAAAETPRRRAEDSLKLLDLLAFRTLQQCQQRAELAAGTAPVLKAVHLQKLRKMSLASLADEKKTLTYDELEAPLDCKSQDDLEEFLIDAITSGIVVGTIDQRARTLHVTSCIPRHVHKDDIGKILGQLSQWVQLSKGIMSQVDAKIGELKRQEEAEQTRAALLRARVQRELKVRESAGSAASV